MDSGFENIKEFIQYLKSSNTVMFEEYEHDSLREFIKSDSQAIRDLVEAFEDEDFGEGFKAFFASIILEFFPHKPSYIFLTEKIGLSPLGFTESKG